MESFATFLEEVDPYFQGKVEFVTQALGSNDMDEILENVSERVDLVDLDEAQAPESKVGNFIGSTQRGPIGPS